MMLLAIMEEQVVMEDPETATEMEIIPVVMAVTEIPETEMEIIPVVMAVTVTMEMVTVTEITPVVMVAMVIMVMGMLTNVLKEPIQISSVKQMRLVLRGMNVSDVKNVKIYVVSIFVLTDVM